MQSHFVPPDTKVWYRPVREFVGRLLVLVRVELRWFASVSLRPSEGCDVESLEQRLEFVLVVLDEFL
ncbi:hypothetical protein BBD46_18455 [Natrialba sp. SSL1]|nr:hypothetical protein BBD46_18455 [Natrialba sp. SSL1]